MDPRELNVILVRDYDCLSCGAVKGNPCRTMRHHPGRPRKTGYVTSPHESRLRQYRLELILTCPVHCRSTNEREP